MEIFEHIELQDCPLCSGSAILEEENDWCFYVSCMDCGAHTAEVAYKTVDERIQAAQKASHQWNIGKVLACNPGE